jgi:hypothetical protein
MCMYSNLAPTWLERCHIIKYSIYQSVPVLTFKFLQEICSLCFFLPQVVNNPILYAAIMILWLIAVPGILIMSSVYRIVIIMSLVVPATVCLLILVYLGAIIIAQCTQWSPDCKIWNHSTILHNWRYWQQSFWNWGLYCASAEVWVFMVYQLHIKGLVLYYWNSLRCIINWIVINYRGLKFPHTAVLLVLESDGACTGLNGHCARKSAVLVLVCCYKARGDREQDLWRYW